MMDNTPAGGMNPAPRIPTMWDSFTVHGERDWTERDWRHALVLEAGSRAAAPVLLRLLIQLRSVSPKTVDLVNDLAHSAAYEALSMADALGEALRHVSATSDGEDDAAVETKLAQVFNLARNLGMMGANPPEVVTDLDETARVQAIHWNLYKAICESGQGDEEEKP